MDEIIRGLDTAQQRSDRGGWKGEGEENLGLEDVKWNAEDHGAMLYFLEQVI